MAIWLQPKVQHHCSRDPFQLWHTCFSFLLYLQPSLLACSFHRVAGFISCSYTGIVPFYHLHGNMHFPTIYIKVINDSYPLHTYFLYEAILKIDFAWTNATYSNMKKIEREIKNIFNVINSPMKDFRVPLTLVLERCDFFVFKSFQFSMFSLVSSMEQCNIFKDDENRTRNKENIQL
jgi:hypothetical protein